MTARIGDNARTNLVFARIGPASLHRHWLAEPPADRNWDLQLSSYDMAAADDSGAEGDLPLSHDGGTKWDSVCRYFRRHPEALDRYDYVMFPDDDLLFDSGGLSEAFRICRERNLAIAQPALLPSSFVSYPILLQCPRFRLRYLNYVEPMAPIIQTAYFRRFLPYLEQWSTGWGQDDIWTLLMPDPVNRAAVIDAVPMLHTRPLYTGNIYRTFERLGMDPQAELNEIRTVFTNLPAAKIVYGGILRGGRRIGRKRTSLLNGLHLLRAGTSVRHAPGIFRVGMGMLLRIATRLRYRPSQVRLDPAFAATLPPSLHGALSCAS